MSELAQQHSESPVFFYGGGRDQVLEHLEHLTAWGRSLVMLTGPLGAGKTAMINRVVSHIQLRTKVNAVRPPVGFLSNGEELLRHVAAGMGARPSENDGEEALVALVVQHAVADATDGRFTLLVIDDAHELSTPVLRTVSQLVANAKETRAINVLLAGEPTLPAQLTKANPSKGLGHEMRLRALTLDETRNYLTEQLPTYAAVLEAADQVAVYRRSEGWPGRIQQEAEKELTKRKKQRRRFPTVHALALGALAVAFIAVLMLQGSDEPVAVPATPLTLPNQPAPSAPPSDTENRNARVPVSINLPRPPDEQAQDEGTQAEATTGSDKQLATAPAPVTPSTVPASAPPTPTVAPSVAPTPTKQAEAKALTASGINASTEWARREPANNFTLQLIGVSSIRAANRFTTDHAQLPLSVVRTRRGGQEWFLVVHGSYSTRTQAQTAFNALPGAKDLQPWIRTFEGIHADLQ